MSLYPNQTRKRHMTTQHSAARLQPVSRKGERLSDRELSRRFDLLTEEARTALERGDIPDLSPLCLDLYQSVMAQPEPNTVVPFIPLVKQVRVLDEADTVRYFRQDTGGLNLVLNEKLRVALIYWHPGQRIDIHGHARGGCVLKVLQGKLLEKRYSPETEPRLLAVSTYHRGAMAYIDDDMAWHAVENPYRKPAISLHVYTPGM